MAASEFFNTVDVKGNLVAAKTVVDASGNTIVNPNTALPMIFPASYNINDAIALGESLKNSIVPGVPSTLMVFAFMLGGPQDLQRTYNGITGGEAVRTFKDAASYHLGVVARAAGYSLDEILAGGGAHNFIVYQYNLFKKFWGLIIRTLIFPEHHLTTQGMWRQFGRALPPLRPEYSRIK